MNIDNKTEQLIIILTRETFSGGVIWENEQAPSGLTKGTENLYPLYLQTNYKGTVIGLYQRRFKHFHDEFEYYWCEEIGMCVVGDYETVLWEYNQRSSTLINLFEAAREQASGINSILDDLLK